LVESIFKDHSGESRLFTDRVLVAGVLVLAALLLVTARLFQLQVESHEHFSTLSKDNRVRIEPLPPTRGLIYDANGILLANNYPSYSLEITIEKVPDLDAAIADLGTLVEIEDKDIEHFERSRRRRRRFEGVPIRTNLSQEEVARFAVNGYRFPGIDVRAQLVRSYPFGDDTAHVLSYVGRINEAELKRIDTSNYAGTDYIGKGGVEKAYEDLLHGKVGHQQVEVNARGQVLRVLEAQPPQAGKDLKLFLDIRLQREAAAALGEQRGAVVAIDPRTGGVLALVSRPSFDPNLFVEGIGSADYKNLRDSPDKPLFNRAIRGQYPPGSTVKPFVGLGGLETGSVGASDTKWCPGFYQLPGGSHKYRDWKRWGHGTVDLEKAIIQSCDVYFYRLAHDMGVDRLHDFLSEFGFGKTTGVDLSGELGGLLPSREWKERTRRQPWFAGETLIMGIGQGSFLATPLQLATATAALAARGRLMQPRVARATEIPGSESEREIPTLVRQLPLSHRNIEEVIAAMEKVVQSPSGTARRIRTDAYRIAGKTGTAQVFTVGQKERYRESQVAERKRDHALFVAFAPVEDPRVAVAVIVENGGHGGSVAAPIARQVMDAYLLGGTTSMPSTAPVVEDGD
jgi:penicillin-binding protein 2